MMRALLAIAALGCAGIAVGSVLPSPWEPLPGSAAVAQSDRPTSNGLLATSPGSSPGPAIGDMFVSANGTKWIATSNTIAPYWEPLPSDADSCCGPTWECEVCR